MLNDAANLDSITVLDQSHLVITGNINTTDIVGEEQEAMVHVVEDGGVTVHEEFTINSYIGPDAVLKLERSHVSLYRYMLVHGGLQPSDLGNQSFSLERTASVIINSTVTNTLKMEELHIDYGGSLEITELMSLEIVSLSVLGQFLCWSEIDIPGLHDFFVNTLGRVDIFPASHVHLGNTIHIKGEVNLRNHIDFLEPCTQLLLDGGNLTFPSDTDVVVMECDTVELNSHFSPGIVSFGSGIESLVIGTTAMVDFTVDGPIITESVSISGSLNISNLVQFYSGTTSDNRMESFVIHSNGSLVLNQEDEPGYLDGVAQSTSCSVIKAEDVTLNGLFDSGQLDIDVGFDSVTLNQYGNWTFTPCGTYHIYEIRTNGTIASTTPLVLKGKGKDKVHQITVEKNGVISLDSESQTGVWSGFSEVGVHVFDIYGHFYPGELKPRVIMDGSWDTLNIHAGGHFYFQPHEHFYVDNVYVDGKFVSYAPLNVSSFDTSLIFHIASNGRVIFDSMVSDDWTGQSSMIAYLLQMDSGSYFQSGDTIWDIRTATIGGSLYMYPSTDVKMIYFEITGSGSVDISRTVQMMGVNLTISGTLDIAYQHSPENSSSGSELSEVLYKNVKIYGVMKAGSLYFGPLEDGSQSCETVLVSGTLDVSEGGYLADNGPGEVFLDLLNSFTIE